MTTSKQLAQQDDAKRLRELRRRLKLIGCEITKLRGEAGFEIVNARLGAALARDLSLSDAERWQFNRHDFGEVLPRVYEVAIHEAGHAIAALRAGWPFGRISLHRAAITNEHKVGPLGWFGWGEHGDPLGKYGVYPSENEAAVSWWRSFENDFETSHGSGKAWRDAIITVSLAGAAAERQLAGSSFALPSLTDLIPLMFAGHYPMRLEYLFSLADTKARGMQSLIELGDAVAADMPMALRFAEDNAREIVAVAEALTRKRVADPDAENVSLSYDEIVAICAAWEPT